MASIWRGYERRFTRAGKSGCVIATNRAARASASFGRLRLVHGDSSAPDRLVRTAPRLPKLPDRPGDRRGVPGRTLPRAAERIAGEMASDTRQRQGDERLRP